MKTIRRRATTAVAAALVVFLVAAQTVCAQVPAAPSNTPAPAAPASSGRVNLDLSSGCSTSAVRSQRVPVEILVGGVRQTIMPGQPVTPAEHVAVHQVLRGGSQSIVIGADGAAAGGTLVIGQHLARSISNLVIPQGVTVFDRAATLDLAGNLTNAGSLFALPSSPAASTAGIIASSIFNQQGGLISSVLTPGGFAAQTGNSPSLDLSLYAVNCIVNAGAIASAGSLSLTAGGSIINALPQGASGRIPVIQAAGHVNLNTANIVNAGLISSAAGNINIASQMAQTLAINNAGGTLRALSGSINAETASAAQLGYKPSLTITGGDLAARELNLTCDGGHVTVNCETMDGRLNAHAGDLHIGASTPTLSIGKLELTGDPVFWNAGGNVSLSDNYSFSAQNFSIIASGDIITGAGAGGIDVSSNWSNAGSILMIAGAHFTDPASGSGGPNDTATVVKIDGPSASGGKIDLTGITSLTAACTNTTGAAGSITLVAYYGSAGTGTIKVPDNITINTTVRENSPTSLNGSVTIIAGAPSGDAIRIGSINATGNIKNPQAANNGMVLISSATPALWGNPAGSSDRVFLQKGNAFTDNWLKVSNPGAFTAGQTIFVNPLGPNGEQVKVLGTRTDPDPDIGLVLVISPLTNSHTVNETVYTPSSTLTVLPVGTPGPVPGGLPMTTMLSSNSYGGIISPGTQQSGNIAVSGTIDANNAITIATNPSASAGNGLVQLNGSMSLSMNPYTDSTQRAYQSFPAISITGAAITVGTSATISSQIISSGQTYANCPNTVTIVTRSLANNGKITGGAPSSTPYSNAMIDISSPDDLSVSGSGTFSVPSYSVIELSAADKHALNLGSTGGAAPAFSTGTGGLVIFDAQGAGGTINVAQNQIVKIEGGPVISINTPNLSLSNGSSWTATGNSIYAIGSGYTASDLTVTVAGNASILTGAGGAIRMRPTDGQSIKITGGLGFGSTVARLAVSGGGSIDAGSLASGSYTRVSNPAGGILGGEFQPYPGPYFSPLNGNPLKFVAFSAYPYQTVLAMMSPIVAEQQFQVLSTYTQAYSTSYVIGAAKQLGLRVSAGIFVYLGADGTNLAPLRTDYDSKWALSQASKYGNVIDLVVGNEDIVAGPSGADPSPSINALVSTIQSVQALRGNYINPLTGAPFTRTDLPATTRQEIGVLVGDVTDYASMRTLLNTVENHIYGNVYPFFDSGQVLPGLKPGMSQTAFQNLVLSNMDGQYKNVMAAWTKAKTLPTPVLNPPDFQVSETGWATPLLNPVTSPGYGYAGYGLPEQSLQWAQWYYPAMQKWSLTTTNGITKKQGVAIMGYFGLYDEPWKGIDGGPPAKVPHWLSANASAGATSINTGGSPNFPVLTPMSILIDAKQPNQEVVNIYNKIIENPPPPHINGTVLTVDALLKSHNNGAVLDAGHPEEPFFGIWTASGTFPLNTTDVNDSINGYVFTLTGTSLKFPLPVYPNGQPPPSSPTSITSAGTLSVASAALPLSLTLTASNGLLPGQAAVAPTDKTSVPGGGSNSSSVPVVLISNAADLLPPINYNIPRAGWNPAGELVSLPEGNGVFTPDHNLTVRTPLANVAISAGSAVMIVQGPSGMAVLNLYDDRTGSVSVSCAGGSYKLPVGRQLVVSNNQQAAFDDVNPSAIGYRNLAQSKSGNVTIYASEFSLSSALTAADRLGALLGSARQEDRQLASKIMKTAAAMSVLSSNRQPFKTSKCAR